MKPKTDCKNGEVKLVEGALDSEGTVEVCLDNLWGLIAEAGWSESDAQVVCQQLGFPLDGNDAWIYVNITDMPRMLIYIFLSPQMHRQ